MPHDWCNCLINNRLITIILKFNQTFTSRINLYLVIRGTHLHNLCLVQTISLGSRPFKYNRHRLSFIKWLRILLIRSEIFVITKELGDMDN